MIGGWRPDLEKKWRYLQKINSQWLKDINVKGKIIKHFEKIVQENIFMKSELGRIFLQDTKAKIHKGKDP